MKSLLMAGVVIQALAAFHAQAGEPREAEFYRAAKLHFAGETAAAVQIWKKWAEQGDVDAAYNLAVIHQHADGVAYDPAQALAWYRIAAERGDKAAQYALGQMYLKGEGVAADEAKAHEWFTANRRHHLHHLHTPQFQQWRKQAQALIEERDRREAFVRSRQNDAQILADLQRRAGIGAAQSAVAARIELAAHVNSPADESERQ
ncbi:tetratricopeptide repeat protein [Sulfuricystis multivorans]|uniref:tetratricopeptide repeat protein n=1 Tax=Sulfuricystis multivorans TaxID=2211108 RepID=UPI001558B3FC|nr:tetratricopeptide repeat protein [Sulfuricystis multivorans]